MVFYILRAQIFSMRNFWTSYLFRQMAAYKNEKIENQLIEQIFIQHLVCQIQFFLIL